MIRISKANILDGLKHTSLRKQVSLFFFFRCVVVSHCCFVFLFFLKIYLFIYFWLCWVFVSVRGLSLVVASGGHSSSRCAGLSLSPSHYRGLSCCGAQAPDAQAQQLWLTGPAAPWHAGSSQTRARTRVPRIGRQTLNHRATREAPLVS